MECHRPGQIGPFALQSYDDAVGWAEMIEEVVRDRRMPPWHPDPKYGHFANDLSLSEAQKELIYKWVAAGSPEGNPKDLPEPKQYAGSWRIPGGPDVVFQMTEEVDVQAEGTVPYKYYVVDTGFTEDKWVKVAEAMPGNRGVVHHMIVFMKPPGMGLFGGAGGGGNGAAPMRPTARSRRQKSPRQTSRRVTVVTAAEMANAAAARVVVAAARRRSVSCAALRRARVLMSCRRAWPS